jgi:hypothetical protein
MRPERVDRQALAHNGPHRHGRLRERCVAGGQPLDVHELADVGELGEQGVERRGVGEHGHGDRASVGLSRL